MNVSEPILSTYLYQKGTRLGLPIGGNFELTRRCNFQCKMCYVHQGDCSQSAIGELSADQWLAMADAARAQGMLFLLLTGGEPLLRSDFLYLFGELKKMGLMVSVNTNGSLVDGEILSYFRHNPPSRVNITLYGGSNHTYEKLCGQPAYDTVVQNIRQLQEAGVSTRLNVAITKYNVGDIPAIVQTAKALNIHMRTSAYMYPPIRQGEALTGQNAGRLTPEEAALATIELNRQQLTAEQFEKWVQSQQKMDCGIEDMTDVDAGGDGVTCRAGRSSFWLTWDGKMLPCGMMTCPVAMPLKVGFSAAWEKLKDATAKIRLPDTCSSCEKRAVCHLCAASAYAETGKFEEKPLYICQMTETMHRLLRQAQEK